MPATHAPETLNQVLFVSFVPRFPLCARGAYPRPFL